MSIPLVSIILPVHNGERFLRQSIESCLKQSYENIEVVVVNDCSTDNSLAIAQEYASEYSQLQVVNNERNLKLPASLNVGHQAARGAFITWTSDDNLFHSNAIAVMLQALTETDSGMVYADCDVINDEGEKVGFLKAKDPDQLLASNVVGACFLYKKEVFEKNNGYDLDLPLIEDYDFWLRTAALFYIAPVHQVLYDYRFHDESLTSKIKNDPQVKVIFEKNKQKMYRVFLEEKGILKIEALLSFLSVTENDSEKYRRVFDNPNFFEDIDLLSTKAKGLPNPETGSYFFKSIIDVVLRTKQFQNSKTLFYLLKNAGHYVAQLPLKRKIVLFKKCIF